MVVEKAKLSDKSASPTRCYYRDSKISCRDHRARARRDLEILRSSLHRKDRAQAPSQVVRDQSLQDHLKLMPGE